MQESLSNIRHSDAKPQIEAERKALEEKEVLKNAIKRMALLNSNIDMTIKDLQNYQLTYGELVKALDAMEQFYKEEGEEYDFATWRDEYCLNIADASYQKCYGWLHDIIAHNSVLSIIRLNKIYPPHPYAIALLDIMKRDVKEKMGKYQHLSGTAHPRSDEFSNM